MHGMVKRSQYQGSSKRMITAHTLMSIDVCMVPNVVWANARRLRAPLEASRPHIRDPAHLKHGCIPTVN